MEPDPWSLPSPVSRRRPPSHQSRFDAYFAFDEVEAGEDDLRMDFPCPFCPEDLDIFGLCCHIDEEHQGESKNGVCPVCADRVGMDMVGHITMLHGNYFKVQRKRRQRKSSSSSQSTISLLKKELQDGNWHTLFGGSPFLPPTHEAAPDPLLFSFINSIPPSGSAGEVKPSLVGEESMDSKNSDKKSVESVEPTLSLKDQEERAQRSAFAQELLMSTIFDDAL